MANKVISLTINTVDQARKKNETNINYVNPEATNEKLSEFAQMLIDLTTDTYDNTVKVTKESVV